jgi:hypothetical protein
MTVLVMVRGDVLVCLIATRRPAIGLELLPLSIEYEGEKKKVASTRVRPIPRTARTLGTRVRLIRRLEIKGYLKYGDVDISLAC